jgi:hypothetical protein
MAQFGLAISSRTDLQCTVNTSRSTGTVHGTTGRHFSRVIISVSIQLCI